MKTIQDQKDDVLIFRLAGQLVGGAEGDALREAIQAAFTRGCRKVLVDLHDVSWVNSTGLGILISGHLSATAHGGSLLMTGASRRIESIFQVTRLNTVFRLYPDEESALLQRAG
jgi:anti-sigma B factor antagonist